MKIFERQTDTAEKSNMSTTSTHLSHSRRHLQQAAAAKNHNKSYGSEANYAENEHHEPPQPTEQDDADDVDDDVDNARSNDDDPDNNGSDDDIMMTSMAAKTATVAPTTTKRTGDDSTNDKHHQNIVAVVCPASVTDSVMKSLSIFGNVATSSSRRWCWSLSIVDASAAASFLPIRPTASGRWRLHPSASALVPAAALAVVFVAYTSITGVVAAPYISHSHVSYESTIHSSDFKLNSTNGLWMENLQRCAWPVRGGVRRRG